MFKETIGILFFVLWSTNMAISCCGGFWSRSTAGVEPSSLPHATTIHKATPQPKQAAIRPGTRTTTFGDSTTAVSVVTVADVTTADATPSSARTAPQTARSIGRNLTPLVVRPKGSSTTSITDLGTTRSGTTLTPQSDPALSTRTTQSISGTPTLDNPTFIISPRETREICPLTKLILSQHPSGRKIISDFVENEPTTPDLMEFVYFGNRGLHSDYNGWKVHVSTAHNFDATHRVLSQLLPFLMYEKLFFKTIGSGTHLRKMWTPCPKGSPSTQCGKTITIYPIGLKPDEFCSIIKRIDQFITERLSCSIFTPKDFHAIENELMIGNTGALFTRYESNGTDDRTHPWATQDEHIALSQYPFGGSHLNVYRSNDGVWIRFFPPAVREDSADGHSEVSPRDAGDDFL